MNKNWIDFKELRSKLDFERVLQHYGVEVKRKGNQHHGFCPLPNHQGKKNSPSFSANLERGIFQCFGCSGKGNVLEFAALMEKADPKDGNALHRIAAELQRQFCPELGDATETPKTPAKKLEQPKSNLPVVVNPPLGFTLKDLDAGHPYLLGRGFTPETIERFGLGFCSRGLLKDRVAIPLHDGSGTLVGYAGRVVDDKLITKDNPRYRFPGDREREGKLIEFRKSLLLYNGFRIQGPVDDLIVVESFTSVWWLVQNGLPNVVGTMGSDCSEEQAELIVSLVKPDGHVWMLTDGDPAGDRHARSQFIRVALHRFVRWVRMNEGKQPTHLSVEQLKNCFNF
ncbi:MAG TPA: CHC2 zinc finger domain-containing protein [Verrucomicrobiae bacterium]|nr:CHC2 zinc finger domain-containing protein [Verrucomicrobiae bacterium]